MAKPNSGSFPFLQNGIVTGLIGAATMTAVIALYGKAKMKNAWTPFNGIAHMFFGDKAAQKDGFVGRETLVGLGLNGVALTVWGVLYEAVAGKTPFPKSLTTGAAASATIYALDYHIFPPKLRPGFDKRLGVGSIIVSYLLLALTFGLSPLWKRGNK